MAESGLKVLLKNAIEYFVMIINVLKTSYGKVAKVAVSNTNSVKTAFIFSIRPT